MTKDKKPSPEERLVRDVFLPSCTGCGGLTSHLPFCLRCGAANPGFSKEGFAETEGQTIEEALKGCRGGHISALGSAAGDEKTQPAHPDFPYCGYCGELLCTEERIARTGAKDG